MYHVPLIVYLSFFLRFRTEGVPEYDVTRPARVLQISICIRQFELEACWCFRTAPRERFTTPQRGTAQELTGCRKHTICHLQIFERLVG